MPSPLLTKHFRSCALAFCNSSSFFAVPIAQLRHMHAQVLRSLHIGHASLLDQAHSLKLELAGKLPSLHDPPPAPSKHLTRCPRNRVQAKGRHRLRAAFSSRSLRGVAMSIAFSSA